MFHLQIFAAGRAGLFGLLYVLQKRQVYILCRIPTIIALHTACHSMSISSTVAVFDLSCRKKRLLEFLFLRASFWDSYRSWSSSYLTCVEPSHFKYASRTGMWLARPFVQRADFAWTSTILPLKYASTFSVLAGYYEMSHSPAFYASLVILAGLYCASLCCALSPVINPST